MKCGMKLLRYSILGMDKSFNPILYDGRDDLSPLGLKLTHASKSDS